ncbi:MAG: flagellar protein FlaG [Cyanobacteria bacterium NC_groundwater_1444_Ag_S-0.65um_54_12]|nr:flagellar protein FlaG [Cyanobacteria bacterium NC_groundwater_1444_Ag_S-0.65um_54_12]
MKIEGTIAASAVASNQALALEATSGALRERSSLDTLREQALTTPDAALIASEQRVVGTKLLSSALEAVERLLGELNDQLTLQIHKDGKRLLVRILQRKTGEQLREMSAEQFLDMVESLGKQVAGFFVDARQ